MKSCRNWDFAGLAQITGHGQSRSQKRHSVIEPQDDWTTFWESWWADSRAENRIVALLIVISRENFVRPHFYSSYWTLSYCTVPNIHRSGTELAGRGYWFSFVWLFDVPSWSSCLLCWGLNTSGGNQLGGLGDHFNLVETFVLGCFPEGFKECFVSDTHSWSKKSVKNNLGKVWFARVTALTWIKDLGVKINTGIYTPKDRKICWICTFSCRQSSDEVLCLNCYMTLLANNLLAWFSQN